MGEASGALDIPACHRLPGPQEAAKKECGTTGPPRAMEEESILVLAAASLTDVLPAVAEVWVRERSDGTGPLRLTFSFDATSRLARQAATNPAASVFVGADLAWMRWLRSRGSIAGSSATRIAGNELATVVPANVAATPASPDEFANLDRIALAGENVPAGRYAREALSKLGLWDSVEPKVVNSNSVRAALEWAARAEVDAAVVYLTDARVQPGVKVAFVFDPSLHRPVGYYAAALEGSSPAARDFANFLASDRAGVIFREYGFREPQEPEEAAEPLAATSPPSLWAAIRISVVVSLLATLAATPPAISLGWLFARRSFRGKTALSTAVTAPLVMPPVVTGFLLLSLFGADAPAGRLLADAGFPIPFTIFGAALAALVVGLPLYVVSVRNAFGTVDPRYEEVAATLGASPPRIFAKISLPLALPGIAAGAMLAFARSLGEFGATVVLAGNIEGSTRTISLAVYTLLESPGDHWRVWTLVAASVAVSLMALVVFESLSRRQRERVEEGVAKL